MIRTYKLCNYNIKRFPNLLLAALIMLGLGQLPVTGQAEVARKFTPSLHTSELFSFAKEFGSTSELTDSYKDIVELAYLRSQFGANDLIAFEENRFFAYALGDTSKERGGPQEGRQSGRPWRLVRRFIFLRPSTFVVDDEVQTASSTGRARWLLYSSMQPTISGRLTLIAEGESELVCETLLPESVTRQVSLRRDRPRQAEGYLLDLATREASDGVRFLHVLHARRRSDERSVTRAEAVTRDGQLHLTITTDRRIFRLTLPPARMGAGDIAISRDDGKELLARRPLPSGILPHGPEGVKMLDLWDESYRGGKRPPWDAGRPSGELQRIVEKGIVRACQAVDLGCGSGTDAIYLASKGFDVTAIDIAPTALSQAEEKARTAGVKVRWLLADVLAPPRLEPFDFIFDRGCYHEVRIHNANAYVETIRRLSRPGTHFLLLAGNPNELPLQYAPPQVAEEDIRSDFSSLFDFEWLRETRFETTNTLSMGPLAWSVMLRRKGKE
jgi:methyl halide transferase